MRFTSLFLVLFLGFGFGCSEEKIPLKPIPQTITIRLHWDGSIASGEWLSSFGENGEPITQKWKVKKLVKDFKDQN